MIRISTVQRRHGEDPAPSIPLFVRRLNEMNPRAIQYRLVGDELRYDVLNAALLRGFDRDMMRYIDDRRTIPLRFVAHTREFVDDHFLGTVDLDDLLNSSPFSFAMNMLHILEERIRTPNYDSQRRIFQQPHRQALEHERDYLRRVLGDPSIRFTGERDRGTSRLVFTFRSDRGYRVEHLFTTLRGRTSSEVFVVDGGRRVTLQEFLGR